MNYTGSVEFEWDEEKSSNCFRDCGFDFAYAARAFFDPERLVVHDCRYDYGEARFRVTGKIDERLFVVIYTPRGYFLRIISARKANQREVWNYENRASKS